MSEWLRNIWQGFWTNAQWRQILARSFCQAFNPPRDVTVWLGPMYIPPGNLGEPTTNPIVGILHPESLAPWLQPPFGITGFEFKLHGQPFPDPNAPPIQDVTTLPLLDDPNHHFHRLHLHHVNVLTTRDNHTEELAGAGHDRRPVNLPAPYFYRVDPGDVWEWDMDVRNIHLNPLDVEDGELDYWGEGPDVTWVVALEWTIHAERCISFKQDKRVFPIWMSANGATLDDPYRRNATFSIPPRTDIQQPRVNVYGYANGTPASVNPHVTASIIRQDQQLHPDVDCTEVDRDVPIVSSGTVVLAVPHLHNGAADLSLHVEPSDAVVGTPTTPPIAMFRNHLSGEPESHPIHILDTSEDATVPFMPTHVDASKKFRLRTRYSNNTTYRDDLRAAGELLDGSNYDYNNSYEPTDVMAVIVVAINPDMQS
jgi:hypothetical protein